jgi:hypothetical protein
MDASNWDAKVERVNKFFRNVSVHATQRFLNVNDVYRMASDASDVPHSLATLPIPIIPRAGYQ